MLVLSRLPEQAIMIGDKVKLVYLGKDSDGRVRLGIEAPKEIKVARAETLTRNEGKGKA